MGKETKFKYSGFELEVSALQSHVNSVKKSKKYNEDDWGYAENQINSIILAVADGNFEASDIRAFKLLEELVEWAGFDEEGHYSDEAKKAMDNLYQRQLRLGFKPQKKELKDIKLDTPWQAWVKKTKAILNAKKPKFTFSERTKKWVLRGVLAFGIGVATVGSFLGLKKSGVLDNAFEGKSKTEQKAKVTSAAQDSTKTKVLSLKEMRSSSRQKIESHKKAYQNKMAFQSDLSHQLDSTVSAGHEIRLEAFYGVKKANKLVNDMKAKLGAGILNSGKYTAADLVYYKKIVETYVDSSDANYKLVHDVLGANKKVSAEQNKAFLDYLSMIGDNGENLQAKALKSGKKLTKNSSIDKASVSVKAKFVQNKKHYKNLKQVKQAKLQAQKMAQR